LRRHFPQVEYVRNITDIDDKIIQRAVENKEDIYALTNRFIAAMHEDEFNMPTWATIAPRGLPTRLVRLCHFP
jgi:cysteinyl-tRNA synthetase